MTDITVSCSHNMLLWKLPQVSQDLRWMCVYIPVLRGHVDFINPLMRSCRN